LHLLLCCAQRKAHNHDDEMNRLRKVAEGFGSALYKTTLTPSDISQDQPESDLHNAMCSEQLYVSARG